ncbi:24794_t:CDS:2, partial [Gigaspora margarita]
QFTSLVLVKDKEKAIAFACAKGKEVITSFHESATTVFIKVVPPDSGIKA